MAASSAEPAQHTAARDYPADHLADLAVSLLAGLEGNDFGVATALSTAPATTRATRAAQGCCTVQVLPQAPLPDESPFYFGLDLDGYCLVSPRLKLEGWPVVSGGGYKPIRLTRWLVRAPPGTVVSHRCDNPACI